MQIQHCNPISLIKWLHDRPFPIKFATISENSDNKTFFFKPDFIEARNSELHSCNAKEKGLVLHNYVSKIFEILEHSF